MFVKPKANPERQKGGAYPKRAAYVITYIHIRPKPPNNLETALQAKGCFIYAKE